MYDVIIVGAGPAGSSCAYNVKRFHPNASVLLIDKAQFPRYKPCGGGISPDVKNYIDFDLSESLNSHCRELSIVINTHKQNAPCNIFMVRREHFDYFLVKKAQERGIDLLTHCEVIDIENTKSTVMVKTKNAEYAGKIVVLAEGSAGKLARKLKIAPNNNVAAALEYEHYYKNGFAEKDGMRGKCERVTAVDTLVNEDYERTFNEADRFLCKSVMEINFDEIQGGYAWVFPKSDGLSIGIGGFFAHKKNSAVGLPQKLKNYLAQQNTTEFDRKHWHGHPLQLYSGRKKLVHDRMILIGEIAGCVDPLTGEGIRPAIKSAYFAAQCIATAILKNDIREIKKYDRTFHQEIGKDFRYARIASFLLNWNMQAVLSARLSTGTIGRFMDIFSGRSTYQDIITPRKIMRVIKMGLLQKQLL